jgi:hypothetical protein
MNGFFSDVKGLELGRIPGRLSNREEYARVKPP